MAHVTWRMFYTMLQFRNKTTTKPFDRRNDMQRAFRALTNVKHQRCTVHNYTLHARIHRHRHTHASLSLHGARAQREFRVPRTGSVLLSCC